MRIRALITWIILIGPAALLARLGPGQDQTSPGQARTGPGRDAASTAQVQSRSTPAARQSPVLSPDAALDAFRIQPGFRISLFAAEPMIEDPVAMAFDADGRLFVCEMRSYMPDIDGRGELVPTSRIRCLEDADGDGRADRAWTFLDGLVLPRAILPCFGGLLVIAPPDLIFARDTDGDGRADQQTTVLTGFNGLDNPEHAGNALRWGLDNWIHIAQFHLEFRFDGDKAVTREIPTVGQWGMSLDARGRQYYTPNSDALRSDRLPLHYARRNPHQAVFRGVDELVCADRSAWPAGPTTGVNRGYRPGQLRPDGSLATITAACGPALYLAHRFPDDCFNNAFVCEAAGNFVMRLRPDDASPADDGPTWKNAYEHAEFLTSSDERFRPTDIQVGPDGALYVCDMHRGVIQHRTYLTEYLADQIHRRRLEKPIGLGRIFRITPEDNSAAARPPRLSEAADDELVRLLAHPDQWWRLTAQRLLVERRATHVADAVRAMLHDRDDPLARLHALWTLDGLGVVRLDDARAALHDADPAVIAAGCRVAESLDPARVADELARVADAAPRLVRAQAALSLGELNTDRAREILAELARTRADDAIMRSAVVSSLADHELETARRLLGLDPGGPGFDPGGPGFDPGGPGFDPGGPGQNAADWPRTSGERSMLAELIDAALRSDSAAGVLDLAADLARPDRPRAELVLARVASAMRLDSANPRRLSLAAEPRRWSDLLADGAGSLADRAAAVDRHLSWPGRPGSDARQLSGDERALLARGRTLFVYCQGCHGPDGDGMNGRYPPLNGSARVLGDAETLARILIRGLEGPLERAGHAFNDTMPPVPYTDDRDLAAVISYVRSAWENNASPVGPELVAKVRAEEKGHARPLQTRDLPDPAAEQSQSGRDEPRPDRAGFIPLFNGRDFDGWEQKGGRAAYRVEDGVIVGESRPNSPNSFLCTTRDYADFELRLDFKVDEELNSGVQVRSHASPDFRGGVVHGYQVEIDPSDRAWSCGLYEEQGRGWLDPLDDNPAARHAFRHGDWNHMRVLARGHRIQTWLNGVPAADLSDPDGAGSGFIALQVHNVGDREDPLRVRWRNITIRELGPD